MIIKDRGEAEAFLEYAMDTEGMEFTARRAPGGFKIAPKEGTNYDPQVIHAVKRNFKQEWGAFE